MFEIPHGSRITHFPEPRVANALPPAETHPRRSVPVRTDRGSHILARPQLGVLQRAATASHVLVQVLCGRIPRRLGDGVADVSRGRRPSFEVLARVLGLEVAVCASAVARCGCFGRVVETALHEVRGGRTVARFAREVL